MEAGPSKPVLSQEIVNSVAALGSKPAVKSEVAQTLKKTFLAASDHSVEVRVLGRLFTPDDNSISLADIIIAMQKSSIVFQETLQVR